MIQTLFGFFSLFGVTSLAYANGSSFPYTSHELQLDRYGVLDANKCYIYNKNGCISSVEDFDGHESLRTQKYFWQRHPVTDKWMLSTSIWENGMKQPLICATYDYDDRGNCIREVFHLNLEDASLSPLVIDEEGSLVQQATKTFTTEWTYSDTDPAVVTSRHEFDGTYVKFVEKQKGISATIKWCQDQLESLRPYLSFEDTFDHKELLRQTFDENFHILLGICESTGTWGLYNPGKELNPKVKITAINGILNLKENLEATINQISQAHGSNQIYYVYRPTEGWTRDLYSCVFVKLGFVSESSQRLADLWKLLIKEMGGVDGGGTIVHYAHSIGSTDTNVAGTLLTPEERQMIHIVTIGSPTLLPTNSGFKSVKMIASVRDFVAFMGLIEDPIRYANAVYEKDEEIKFVGTHWGWPIVDHLLSFDAYRGIIEKLGDEFIATYGENQKNREDTENKPLQ